jgi:GxxExxY protein
MNAEGEFMDSILKHGEITDRILNAFFKKVYHQLGHGFLEKVYENALALELKSEGLVVQQQMRIPVFYQGVPVGEYYADLVVADKVIVELKAHEMLTDADEAQLLNYLRATPYEVGLLLNFGPRPDFKRRVYDNSRKNMLTWTPELSAAVETK